MAQDDPDWEAVVVDDGATDETLPVAQQWQAAYPDFECALVPEPGVAMHRHAGSLRYNPEALDGARNVMIDLLFDPGLLPERAIPWRSQVWPSA